MTMRWRAVLSLTAATILLVAVEAERMPKAAAIPPRPQSAVDRPPSRPLRFMLHGNMSTDLPSEEYLQFVEKVRPDILIMGVFDQRLYASCFPSKDFKRRADQREYSPRDLLDEWRKVADRLHRNGIRLVGQMELFTLSDRPADLTERTGWFGFYDVTWDQNLLGEKPTKLAADLLEEPDVNHDRAATNLNERPMGLTIAKCGCKVNTRSLASCANKPAWRAVQKQMVQMALDIGVDGFITNRNYTGHCACSDCLGKLRKWFADRYSPEELKSRFDIVNLSTHDLQCVIGMTRDPESVPDELLLEKQRFAKHMVKDFFDDVYGAARIRDADLLLAQWNHMAHFDEFHLDRGHLPPTTRTTFAHGAADERWSLPPEIWGRGENFFWYCNWGTTQNTMLDKKYAGDTVLCGKLLRSMADGRPYVINKYDFYRPRNMMAEAAAMGYVTNAIATPLQSEADRETVLRYFRFLRTHSALYDRADSHAEVAILFPQRGLIAGDAAPLEYVETAGRAMIANHVLFDILPDDRLTKVSLEAYRIIVVAAPEMLHPTDHAVLAQFVESGGKLLYTPVAAPDRTRAGATGVRAQQLVNNSPEFKIAARTIEHLRDHREQLVPTLLELAEQRETPLSQFDAPWTVEVHAYRQLNEKRIVLHFVNYKHVEGAKGTSVVAQEAPIAAPPVRIQFRLPKGIRAASIRFDSPDDDLSYSLKYQQRDNLLEFDTPRFLVYGVCAIEIE